MRKTRIDLVAYVAFCSALVLVCPCHAQFSQQTLHSFGVGGDGRGPNYSGLVQGRDGAWYGATLSGGTNGAGTVYRLNSDGTGYAVLYNFLTNGVDGTGPSASLLQGLDGGLYGAKATGGTNNAGVVFKLNTDGSAYTVLYSFKTNGFDGKYPMWALVQGHDLALYGTTPYGGSNAVATYGGTVFRLGTDGSDYSVLYNFQNYTSTDGQNPGGLVFGLDGALYGTTYIGGTNSGGTVFKLNTDGTDYAELYSFRGYPVDGWNPVGLAQGADGALYGTTGFGGSNYPGGTVFKLNTNGTAYQLLYSFLSTTDAQAPQAAPVQGPDGLIYGTTFRGGINGFGTVFRLGADGAGYTDVYSFTTNSGLNPLAALTPGSDRAMYGTTSAGGSNQAGTVFRLTPFPAQFTSLTLLPGNGVQLSLAGVSNFTYRLDVSTDLVTWTALTNVQNATGTIQFIDSSASSPGRRFYRAVWVP